METIQMSNCCSREDSQVEIVDSLGICGGCGEWCSFILVDEDGNEIKEGE